MNVFVVVLFVLISIVLLSGLFGLLWFTLVEWRPAPVEKAQGSCAEPDVVEVDGLRVVAWNIGYAGLGSDMDFFYDGGKGVRPTRERLRENLDRIVLFLQRCDADLILLQEVDDGSKRNYDLNLREMIEAALPDYHAYYSLNYKCSFVPIPFRDPIGHVRSGVLTLSRGAASRALRYAYPSGFAYPVRLFNLKRGLLVTEFKLKGGKTLWVGNTHNSAFDDGGMRRQELDFLKGLLADVPHFVVAGDWNYTPPGYTPTVDEVDDPYFSPIAMEANRLGEGVRFAVDLSSPSARYNTTPYVEGETQCTLIDFAVCSRTVVVRSCRIVKLGFESSDHNPVVYEFGLLGRD